MVEIGEIEARRLEEQERLDLLKDQDERNRWGQFATPPALALDIARYARNRRRRRSDAVRFLDPAIGTGSFYAALRQVFSPGEVSSAAGIELDPEFARTASRLWRTTGLKVTKADFTTSPPPSSADRFNLILTNPPYVRHHHIGRTDKQRLKHAVASELAIEISGLAGLYSYFVLLCDKWMDDNGLAVWLIPSEFMDVNYGQAVKDYLTKNVTLVQIHRFCPSDIQFSDALVSSAIVVFEKRPPRHGHSALFTFGGRLSKPNLKERVHLDDLRVARKWTKYPRREVPSREDECTLTFGDIFDVKRGLATGANNFFVVPRSSLRKLGIPEACTRPILPSPRYLQDPVIETDTDGYPKIERRMSLIDCTSSEIEIRKQHPKFWAYLANGMKQGIHKGYLSSRRTPWYSQETRPPAPFLCTYMGRSQNGRKPFRFFWNKSEAVAANVYLMLYPKGPLKEALQTNPDLHSTVFEFLQSITPDMFLGESRVYGGGLYKLEPKELARLSAESLRDTVTNIDMHRQMCLFG